MKLLLIGAGYVGMQLLKAISNQKQVTVTTTQPNKASILKSFAQDVLVLKEDNKELEGALMRAQGIVILVAPNKGSNYQTTYLDTARFVTRVLKQKQQATPLVYTSSTSVYEGHNGEVNEESLIHPQSENGKILAATEKCYLEFPSSCVLRLGGIYGPDRTMAKRAEYFSGQTMQSAGLEYTNHIHLDDIVSAIQFCLNTPLEGIYNLVNDAHPNRKELYDTLCTKLNLPLPIWGTEQKSSYLVSNEKIKTTGFRFLHPGL
jgi:nucleoside-diphosphate-sugar epimerase